MKLTILNFGTKMKSKSQITITMPQLSWEQISHAMSVIGSCQQLLKQGHYSLEKKCILRIQLAMQVLVPVQGHIITREKVPQLAPRQVLLRVQSQLLGPRPPLNEQLYKPRLWALKASTPSKRKNWASSNEEERWYSKQRSETHELRSWSTWK